METFGQQLREAIEAQDLPRGRIAEAIGLDRAHLEALERDDFGSLPDDTRVRRSLEALARLIQVDPDQVIADYDAQRRQWQAASPPPGGLNVRARSSRFPRLGLALLMLTLPAIAVTLFAIRSGSPRRTAPAAPPASSTDPAPAKEADVPAPSRPAMRVEPQDSPPEIAPERPDLREPAPPAAPPVVTTGLSIAEHGVGKGIVDHRLTGEAERFVEGERAYFWTRIEGAGAGATIDHVWIREGKEVHVIPIRIGAPRWRAHTYKTLIPGSAGAWVVEARDLSGRVLARDEFRCAPSR